MYKIKKLSNYVKNICQYPNIIFYQDHMFRNLREEFVELDHFATQNYGLAFTDIDAAHP